MYELKLPGFFTVEMVETQKSYHTVTICHREGSSTFVFENEEAAIVFLYRWVKYYWGDTGIDEPIEDFLQDEAIARYFDAIGGESYSLEGGQMIHTLEQVKVGVAGL